MNTMPTRKAHSNHGTVYPGQEAGPQYRICNRCKKEKLASEFYADHRKHICKLCSKADVNTRYAKQKEIVVTGDPNGEGRIEFGDGAVYVGSLRDGKRDGAGVYTFADGRQAKGDWRQGVLKEWKEGRWANG